MDELAAEYGWPLAYILDELPLCQAFALWRAILKRNNPEDTSPGLADEEMLDTQDNAMRTEISGYLRQASRRRHRPARGD